MKKIGKISINPEKVIKNEELVNLRGGYENGDYYCTCDVDWPNWTQEISGYFSVPCDDAGREMMDVYPWNQAVFIDCY